MRMVSRIFFCAWLVTLVTAQRSTVSFVYPAEPTGTTPTLIINVVDTIMVQWSSNFKSTWIFLWCNHNTTGGSEWWYWLRQPTNSTGERAYSPFLNTRAKPNWNSSRSFDCHFALNYEDKFEQGIDGPPIQVTSVMGKSSTTYALKYTTTALPPSNLPSVTANTTSIAPTSTSTSPPNSNSNDSGLGTSGTAGIAVGVVAGVFALAGIAFVVWRNRRKVKALEDRLPVDKYDKPQGVDVASLYQDEDYRHNHVPVQQEPLELDPDKPPGELTGGGVGAGQGQGVDVAPLELDPVQPPSELPGSGVGAGQGPE